MASQKRRSLDKCQIGNYTVIGSYESALVRQGERIVEEFSNSTTTDTAEPDAYKRAVDWAKQQTD